ncbi:MAG: dTDP-4-dehydrorhamnose 3,5-epimerase [Lachnospiraceae bacterium]|nr:dTDP-4-dehydrorhamnose 3,5-epimerase [Lachnospiraceae bacterium]
MSRFVFEETSIGGVYTVQSFVSEDNRGNFIKYFEKEIFAENGIDFADSEDFITCSLKNVVRGMHFQLHHPQKKLVNVIRGKVYDVVVDLRKDSPTYKKWEGWYLTQENRTGLVIPEGCAHGFMSLSDDSLVNYKCAGEYDKDTDTGIRFDDPDIGIDWPVNSFDLLTVGKRDQRLMSFKEFDESCDFEY